MGWSPKSTETHNTSQYSSRTRAPAGVVLHHGATTSADAIIQMEVSGSRQVSSHQVVKDTRNAGIVQEQFRAWSLSDAYWDSWAFTVECANESLTGYTISPASHETLAQTVADWAVRYGFWPHREGDPKTWTVIGHREVYTIHGGSYATACPGGMDLDWIAKRAQDIIRGVVAHSRKKKTMTFLVDSPDLKSAALIGESGNIVKIAPNDRVTMWRWWGDMVKGSVETYYYGDILTISKYLALANPVPKVTGGGSGGATAAEIADAVEAKLADDFAAVNANIDDRPTEFTVTAKN